jgi:hypothetical protein
MLQIFMDFHEYLDEQNCKQQQKKNINKEFATA